LIALAVASIVRDLRQQPAEETGIGIGHGWCGCCWCRSRLLRSLSRLRSERTVSRQQRWPRASLPAVLSAAACGRAPTVPIPDVLMRAAADSTNSLGGRLITVTGFTLKYPDSTDLGRVVIICCAGMLSWPASICPVLRPPKRPAIQRTRGYKWRAPSSLEHPWPHRTSSRRWRLSLVVRIDKPANTYAY